MSNYNAANQARLKLKMKLSNYSWYVDSMVGFMDEGYGIIIHTLKIDDKVRKEIPQVVDGISIRTELKK
jgi:hypothetical protein